MSGFDAGRLRSILNCEAKAGIAVAEVDLFLVHQQYQARARDIS
jgi:hypothetical protein